MSRVCIIPVELVLLTGSKGGRLCYLRNYSLENCLHSLSGTELVGRKEGRKLIETTGVKTVWCIVLIPIQQTNI